MFALFSCLRLSGEVHSVQTGVALIYRCKDGKSLSRLVIAITVFTKVRTKFKLSNQVHAGGKKFTVTLLVHPQIHVVWEFGAFDYGIPHNPPCSFGMLNPTIEPFFNLSSSQGLKWGFLSEVQLSLLQAHSYNYQTELELLWFPEKWLHWRMLPWCRVFLHHSWNESTESLNKSEVKCCICFCMLCSKIAYPVLIM